MFSANNAIPAQDNRKRPADGDNAQPKKKPAININDFDSSSESDDVATVNKGIVNAVSVGLAQFTSERPVAIPQPIGQRVAVQMPTPTPTQLPLIAPVLAPKQTTAQVPVQEVSVQASVQALVQAQVAVQASVQASVQAQAPVQASVQAQAPVQTPARPVVVAPERPLATRLKKAIADHKAIESEQEKLQQTKKTLKAKLAAEITQDALRCKEMARRLKSLLPIGATMSAVELNIKDVESLCQAILTKEEYQSSGVVASVSQSLQEMNDLDRAIVNLTTEKEGLIEQLKARLERSAEKLKQQKAVLDQMAGLPAVTSRLQADQKAKVSSVKLPVALTTLFITSTLEAADNKEKAANNRLVEATATNSKLTKRNDALTATLAAENEASAQSLAELNAQRTVYQELASQANNIIRASRLGRN